jgi:predicted nucleotidyltransferase
MRQRVKVGGLREARRVAGLLGLSSPAKIILFGSQAKGTGGPDSDIDLCVLVDSYQGRPSFRIKQDLYRLLAANDYRFKVDVDLHVYAVDDYEDKLVRDDPFVREIAQGQVLYERQ